MKRITITLAVVLFCAFILAGIAQAADKFAYVDIIHIASEYNKAKDYNKTLDDKATSYEAEIEKKVNEVKGFQDKINLLSDKEKDKKKGELEKKIKDLQEYRRQKEIDLRKEDFEHTKEIAEDIRKAIKQTADKENYVLVFDVRALVYQASAVEDISQKVLDILNKDYTKK